MRRYEPNLRVQKRIRWIIFGLSIIAFTFSVVAIGHCSFISLKCNSDENDCKIRALGIFSFRFQELGIGGCIRYSSYMRNQFEAPEKTARIWGTAAALSTGFAMVCVIATHLFFKCYNKSFWLEIRVLYIVATISQLITFSLFKSRVCDVVECQLGGAGIVCVLNVLVLTTLSVLSWIIPPAEHPVLAMAFHKAHTEEPMSSNIEELPKVKPEWRMPYKETTRVTEIEDSDGDYKMVIKEVANSDGTKTITTTVEDAIMSGITLV